MGYFEQGGLGSYWSYEPILRVGEQTVNGKAKRWPDYRSETDLQIGRMNHAVCRLIDTLDPDFFKELAQGGSGYLYLPFDSEKTGLPEPGESWSGFKDYLAEFLDCDFDEVGIGFTAVNCIDRAIRPHMSSLECVWFAKRPGDVRPTIALAVNADISINSVSLYTHRVTSHGELKTVHSTRTDAEKFMAFCEGFATYAQLINKDVISIPAIYYALRMRTSIADFDSAIPMVEDVFYDDHT